MKNIIKAVLCFGLLFFLSSGKVWALDPVYDIRIDKEIKIMPTNTPTPIMIKPIKDIDIDIMPLATKTPTPVIVTQIITATPQPTAPVSETKPTETVTENQEPTVVENGETIGEEIEKMEEIEEKRDSNNWFWGVIIGLLALILVAQLWSTRDKKGKDKEDDVQS